jgi:hypothetical protein
MDREALAKLVRTKWTGLAERRKQPQLDGAEQRLRTPKRHSELQNRVWSHRLAAHGARRGHGFNQQGLPTYAPDGRFRPVATVPEQANRW